jgi:NhaP-type Na+/H+ or K+/H+ antiporter
MLKLAVVVAILVGYAFVTRKLEHRLSGPMVFMTVGVVISDAMLGWFVFPLNSNVVQIMLKGALALVLFAEASSLGWNRIRHPALPARLLLIAMPVVMIAGAAVALAVFDVLSFWEAAVVAALLAPTDAALGLPVVNNERVPSRIRSALVIEGGLNDGLAVPFALFAAAVAESESSDTTPALVELLVSEIGVAVLVGIGVGWLGGRAADMARSRAWVTDQWARFAFVGVAIVVFAGAEAFHGSGFIATWVGGLVFGLAAKRDLEAYQEFAEDESNLLVLLSFMAFGAIAVGPLLAEFDWRLLLYAVLSLAVIRPAAVALSLIGSGESRATNLFLGWFGPRGLPSMVLALILIGEGTELAEGRMVLGIVIVTVALSVYAHGLTASPLSELYANRSVVEAGGE